jgi:hypothetical protein
VLAEVPCPILTDPPPESVKVGTYTPNARVVVLVWVPEVPVMVNVYWPTVAELLAENVIVLLPVVGLGEKDAVTPLGSPETDTFTLPVKPYCGFT